MVQKRGLQSASGTRDQLKELHLDHDPTFEEIIAGSPDVFP